MSEAERIISEVLQIKSQYQAEVAGSRKQWPRAIKDRVRELATGHDLSLREISEGTGISYYTIANWTQKDRASKFHQVAVVASKPKRIATVTVARNLKSPKPEIATVTVKTPDGFLIRVGSARDAGLLLKTLRRGG